MQAKASALMLVTLVCLFATGCGVKVMIQGRVVDAVSGKPVEGAAVAIKWVHEKFKLPGLGSNDEDIGTTETLTDAQGDFAMPRYINRAHFMGVYKKGYVCWSSEVNFNPLGKTYEERFQKRNIDVQNGMVVRLQPMPDGISPEQREQHACFTNSVMTRLGTGVPTPGARPFLSAIRDEEDLCIQFIRRKAKEN